MSCPSFIPIHTIASKQGKNICQCLPSVHASTGCDSINSVFGIGKKTAYTVVRKMANFVASGLRFSSDGFRAVWIAAVRSLVLAMYGNKGRKCKTLDEVRYVLATTTDESATQLPPTENASKEHASRARYQAFIWCHSHLNKPQLDEPEECGWYRDWITPCHVHKGICSC